MYTSRLNFDAPFTRHVVATGLLRNDPFCLVDVGASGGIDHIWRLFGEDLCAWGFDGLIHEVERLNRGAPTGSKVRYVACLVGSQSFHGPMPGTGIPDNQPFHRSSCVRAAQVMRLDYSQTYNDPSGDGTTVTEKIELDDYFIKTYPRNVDFIKIDTDGFDYEVLQGSRELAGKSNVLGFAVECQFHGLVHDQANVFSNVDTLLRKLGFSLFDMEIQRYSRAVLPARFWFPTPSSTVTGQALWADVIYLRDAGIENYETTWNIEFSVEKLIKLACIYELIGTRDCSAELLVKYRDRLSGRLDVDACLDLLTPPLQGLAVSFRAYNERFEKDIGLFFPD
jgi:FkbM family methyltransferase